MSQNIVLDKSLDFAGQIVQFSERLRKQKHLEIRSQVLRSGTSIGANIFEAQGAESKADFRHKLKIAYKEAWETKFWIKLCLKSESLPNPENLLDQLESIIKLLGKIISST